MDAISVLSNELPKLVVVLPILGGIWAFWRLGRGEPPRDVDRRTALRLAGVLGGLGSLAGAILFGQVLGAWGNQPNWLWAAGWGVGVGALVFASALFGYVFLGRRRRGAVPLIGALLAPVLLMGGPLWLYGQVRTMAERSYEDAQAAIDAERSAFLHVTASVASATREPGSIRLVVTVRSDRTFDMAADVSPPPYFALARRDPVVYAGTEAPAGSPLQYEAGREVRYDLSMSVYEAAAIQGRWTLTVSFNGADGLRYVVRVPVEVPAPG